MLGLGTTEHENGVSGATFDENGVAQTAVLWRSAAFRLRIRPKTADLPGGGLRYKNFFRMGQ